jgi:hypothetical protein
MRLDELQRDLVLPQLDAFLTVAPDAESRAQYQALRAAVEVLEVPDELSDRLGAITEVLLNSGRAREAHGPGAELSLWTLFQATPRGRAVLSSVASVNAALKPIEKQPLEFVSVVARAPGVYSLTLRSAAVQLTVRFEPGGVRLESAEIG